MKTILVTGGCGYIGSHTSLSLLEEDYKLIILDSNVNSSINTLKRIKLISKNQNLNPEIIFEKGDLRDINFVESVFKNSRERSSPVEAVIHFAGLKAVSESLVKPITYWDNNVSGSINLLKTMEKFGCKTLVFSSSASIYGNSEENPIKETARIAPTNPYAFTKAIVEQILEDKFVSSKMSWRIANLRYFNPIGAHVSGLLGEDPLNKPNNLFPIICGVANGKFRKLDIFGNDWPTIDGTGIRDYIHVMDVAEAHVMALNHLIANKPRKLDLNIGRGIGMSVLEVIKVFSEVNNCNVPYEFCSRREGDVASLVADNKEVNKILNWEPKRSLKEMCLDGWKWQKLNPNGYR